MRFDLIHSNITPSKSNMLDNILQTILLYVWALIGPLLTCLFWHNHMPNLVTQPQTVLTGRYTLREPHI